MPSLKSLIHISNALKMSIDGLLFENLEKIASTHYFSTQVDEITKDFTASQKQIIIDA